ncbi:MAG: hypothetical protein ACR2J6_01020 [Thermoleophilaceae bacterium]
MVFVAPSLTRRSLLTAGLAFCLVAFSVGTALAATERYDTPGTTRSGLLPPPTPAVPSPGPSIAGSPQVGGVLTGGRGRWASGTSLSSRWLRCNVSASTCEDTGDTDLGYAVTPADAGLVIKLRVQGTQSSALGTATRTADTQTPTIAAAPDPGSPPTPPSNVRAPTIQGTVREGEPLTGSPGQWTGTAPISFSYAWASCATPAPASCIPRSHARTYRPVAADVGRYLALEVGATNPVGKRQALVFSAAVGKPAVRVKALKRLKPFPVLLIGGRVAGRVTTVTSMRLRRIPRGARVSTSCSGRSCPYRKSSTVLRKGSTVRLRRLEKRLRAGLTVVITVRKGNTLGKYTRLRFRRGVAPARVDRCVAPRSSKPVSCR